MTVERDRVIDEKPGTQVVFPTPLATTREAEGQLGTDEDDAFEGELDLPEPTRALSVRWAPNDRASPRYKIMKNKCSVPPKIVRTLGSVVLLTIVTFLHSQLAISGEFARSKPRPMPTKSPGGWVCNAYGLSGAWHTVTGSPKPTKAAAAASVLKECQRTHSACRNTGCWPR